MQLDKIIIALKLRSPWEAMDLGVLVMRKLWPVIFLPWLIMLIASLSLALFSGYHDYWLFAGFFMWLIKPVYESMILFVLSRAVFGEYLSAADVYSKMGEWLPTGLKTTFLFWRLSLSRSFDMPVSLLENLTGNERKQRLLTLHQVIGSHSRHLTVIGVHFEMIISMALYAVLFFIFPDWFEDFARFSVSNEGNETLWMSIGLVVYACTLFVLEPFYVASGFMLYLNRRIQLEGWDIELDFKNLSHRLKQKSEVNQRQIEASKITVRENRDAH